MRCEFWDGDGDAGSAVALRQLRKNPGFARRRF